MTEKAQPQLLTKHLGHFNNVRLLSHSADLGTLPHKFSANALSFNVCMCGRNRPEREGKRKRDGSITSVWPQPIYVRIHRRAWTCNVRLYSSST